MLKTKHIISSLLALTFSIILILCSCASKSDLNSFEEIIGLDDIISIESIEVDIEYLEYLEEYCNDLRREYSEYVEYQHEDPELVPADEILFYKIRYQSHDAQVIGYMSAPANYQTNEYPVLIYNRGGNGDYGKLEGSEVQHFARYGFIVLASQYRGVDGGTGMDKFGGDDVNDVIKLIDFAEAFSFASGKIFMYGWSRGAMQTYLVLSRDDRIDAAVAGAGPTDLLKDYEESEAGMRGVYQSRVGLPETSAEEYKARSAVHWPERINTPLFLAHGTADERVMAHHSQDLFDAMAGLGKDVKLTLYPGMDHGDPSWAFEGDYIYWLKQH